MNQTAYLPQNQLMFEQKQFYPGKQGHYPQQQWAQGGPGTTQSTVDSSQAILLKLQQLKNQPDNRTPQQKRKGARYAAATHRMIDVSTDDFFGR